jgi:glycosyltransferase involved in cell wall biosynthesis
VSTARPYTFVSCSYNPWSDVWLNRQYIMSRLAREHRVLFCSRAPRWEEYYWKILLHEPIQWRSREVMPHLVDLRPWPWLPRIGQWSDLDRFLQKLHFARIRSSLRRRGWTNRILYVWHPDLADMVGRFDERLVVFHCYDDYTAFAHLSNAERLVVTDRMHRLLQRADLVFATGEALRARLGRDDAHIVPNAVDYALYARALAADEPPPDELARIPHPILAHMGRLNVKVDFRLLAAIARARRDWSVVLIGPVLGEFPPTERAALDELLTQPNAHHIDGKPVPEIPRYLKHIDVGLMAYRPMGWVQHISPIKLYEYTAAGKPIVASDIAELRRHPEYVTIARSPDEWVGAIAHWLSHDAEPLVQARLAFARANSWDARCRTILSLIATKLGDPIPNDGSTT